MTPKQLDKKAKQLLHRRKLAESIEPLEESIKTYMQIKDKTEIATKNLNIRVDGEEILVRLLPKTHHRQLKLKENW